MRQSGRRERYREAAGELGTTRFAADQLASVVDDIDFGITHVVLGSDHRENELLFVRLHRALGTVPPAYVHLGLILGAEGSTVGSLREAGIPAEAVRAYLEELGLPRHDVHLDLPRIRRLAIEAIEAMSDDELARRAGADPEYVPVMRGARDLNEARHYARQLDDPEIAPTADPETLVRFKELVDLPPRDLLRELKAAGGDLCALRLALTGAATGPELSAILAALSKEEALRRVDQALQHAQP